jgi:hypothetical protein
MGRKRILPPFDVEVAGFKSIADWDKFILTFDKPTVQTICHIISTFIKHVKGRSIIGKNSKNCGDQGHWLETQMGCKLNSKNEPDIGGFEMKKQAPKITLGDFSASEYIFSPYKKRSLLNSINNWDQTVSMSRKEFVGLFGTPNPLKDNRYSWSGKCVPKYGCWNDCGQTLLFNEQNDLCVYYSYSLDTRGLKIPDYLKKDDILIALWKSEKLKKNVENKFNKKGFFICKKTGDTFDKITFGKPFDFTYFIKSIKEGSIIFDSGMYQGNNRNYSQFRSSLAVWNGLLV